jgi:TonB-linked SusC/RagA family outer membrane protein
MNNLILYKFKNMRKIISTLIIILSFWINANSQTSAVIKGRVIDKNDRLSLPGVNIVEYDANDRIINGTTTDVNGNFILKMTNVNNVLKASLIGYNTQILKPDPNKTMFIELEVQVVEIGAVQITGKSKTLSSLTNIEDRDFASSKSKIELKEIKKIGVTSVADALQGQISGLDILSASGDPGSGANITIRGISSMGNNKPLIVIDGIPQNNPPNYSEFQLSSATVEDIGNLLKIPVQDIKSIEVLKDAASTAVYGSRGADGVLLIETNKGRLGKVQFDYTYKFSYNSQPPSIPMLNGDEYIMLQLEELHNRYGVFNVPTEISYNKDDPNFYNYSANTDWVKAVTTDAVTNDHYLSISGGGEKTRYFSSISYINEGGTTINTNSQRFSTRVNLDYFLSKRLLFQVQFNYYNNFTRGNFLFNPYSSNEMTIRKMAYMKAPNMSIWEYDENGNLTGEYFTPINSYQGSGSTYFNPVAVGELGKNDNKSNNLEDVFTLRYNIRDWLSFRQSIIFQFGGSKSNNFLPYNALGTDWLEWTVNKAEESNNNNSSVKTESQINFSAPFKTDKHVISGSMSWITEQNKGEWMNIQSNRIPSVDIQDPAVEAQVNWIGNGNWENRLISGVFNLNYKLLDRYIVQTIIRADAYSAFGSQNKWGIFNGISAAWRFSSEPFLKNLKFLGESKLRFSYGTSGRQPNDVYARFSNYNNSPSAHYLNKTGIVVTQMDLTNLKWENITSYDIGLELNLFNDRIFIQGDVYQKITSDILFSNYNIPTTSGYSQLKFFNGGKLENQGWEGTVNFKVIENKNFRLSLNFNTSQNFNNFIDLPDNFNNESSTSIGNGEYPKRIVEGEPIGSFFGFKYLGVYATDEDAYARDANGNILYDNNNYPIPMVYKTYVFKGGDPKYADINYDGKIDLNDVVYLGNSNPKWVGGFGYTIRYKNFDFSCNFHYRLGFSIVNGVAIETEGMNNKNNQSKAVLKRWRAQGQNEPDILPRAYLDHPASNLGSDRYVENGDYLRLLNIMIGYRFGDKVCEKLKVRSMDFSISGRKLFTITKYSGQDPEIGMDASNPFWIGVDYARTPPPRILTMSLSIGF